MSGVIAVIDRALLLVNDDADRDGQPFDTDKSADVYVELTVARDTVKRMAACLDLLAERDTDSPLHNEALAVLAAFRGKP